MRIERAGARRPAFRQNLHGEQFRVNLGFEDRTARAPLSSGFKGFFGSKATYQISGCAIAA
jgi:hypothetical protein